MGELISACFRSSCAASCAGPNSNGTSLRIRLTRALAHFAKWRMNMRHTPMVPRKVRISETFLHGPHFAILSIYFGSGSRPCGVQQCPTATISSVQRVDLKLLYVPPQYLVR